MFQLENAIDHWKQSHLNGDGVSKATAEELEIHLRESVEDLTASGLTPEEAFLVSKHRLGSPGQLSEEFGKVHREQIWLKHSLLALSGFLAVSVILKLINLEQSLAALAGISLGWDSTVVVAGIPLNPGGLAYLLTGIVGASAVIWLISSLSRGRGFTLLKEYPRVEASVLPVLTNTAKRTCLLLGIWAAMFVIDSVFQRIIIMQAGSAYFGELAMYTIVAYPIVILSLFGFSALLYRRYKQVS